jgi:hypothetical protein
MKNFNLRDFGAGIWERSNRTQRVAIVLVTIALAALLPFAGASFWQLRLLHTMQSLFIQLPSLYSCHLA